MTRKELSQYYYLTRQLKDAEARREQAKALLQSPKLSGMPIAAGGVSDKTMQLAMKLIEYDEVIDAYKINIMDKQTEIEDYIQSLDDQFLKSIITYRCVMLKTWDKVADMIGYGTSSESCRKYYERKIPKE